MEALVGLLGTILIFVAAIFILVLVHELGHFLAAKLFGMRVEQFSVGFPPRLFGKKIGHTDYCISATPLGGYVKISGMIDETMDSKFTQTEPKPWEFRSKPVWQRLIVMLAGVIFNAILAAVIFGAMLFHYGKLVIPADNVNELFIPETSIAHEIGLRTGDHIIKINGNEPQHFDQGNLVSMSELTSRGLTFTILRNGEEKNVRAPDNLLDYFASNQEFIGIENAIPSITSGTLPGSPADEAGIQPGDKIVEIDGQEVSHWLQLVGLIQNAEGSLNFVIQRNGERIPKTITPNPDTRQIGIAPVDAVEYFGAEFLSMGFWPSVTGGVAQTWDTGKSIVNGVGMMITGTISARDNLGGPIAIAAVTRDVTDSGGMRGFWNIVAFLSITLAIMNMLPIPVLDGGHVVFLIYEAITRREPSVKVRMALQQIGLILIIGLFIFVTFNDVMRHIVN